MPETNTSSDIKKGLEGVIVDQTAVSKVMPEINSLTYRGYPVQDLAEHCTFEQVAWLLWKGELPKPAELDAFVAQERSLRELSPTLLDVIRRFPKSAHPMDTIRTCVSFLGMEDRDAWNHDPKALFEKSVALFARIPTAIAADYRCRKGLEPITPRRDLTFSENMFHMCFGKVPSKEVVKAFDVSMTLYAEHGFNASTFTSRVVASSLSDIYSTVVAGIGSLKGPLHGGANEEVMHMLQEIKDPKKAREWMLDAIANKRKIMGFGHRVYKNGDSRVPTMKKYFHKMAALHPDGPRLVEMSDILEKTMVEAKNIHPNLDFPAGPAYFLMGFDIDMFTPLFVAARITGWTAHVSEQLADNRLIRPLAKYVGPGQRSVAH